MTGTIFRIERFAIHDGPGIRTTVFLKGCPLRCAWCHSPESQSTSPEFMPLVERCIACGSCAAACPEHVIAARGGPALANGCRLSPAQLESCSAACVAACPTGARAIAGEQVTVASLVEAIERDRVFYDESGGGVTLSGGEPLMQPAFVEAVVSACRARRIHVAVDTSGFGDPAALERLRPDLFLFDVKAIDEDLHREITGVSNGVILENLRRVARLAGRNDFSAASSCSVRTGEGPNRNIVVRFPLVPGLTDSEGNVRDVGRMVSSLGIDRMDVLPYHRAGIAKYERLGRTYSLAATDPPPAARVAQVVEMLSEYGLTVRVGG